MRRGFRAMCLVLLVAGCGNDDGAGTSASTSTSVARDGSSTTTTAADTTTTEDAPASGPVPSGRCEADSMAAALYVNGLGDGTTGVPYCDGEWATALTNDGQLVALRHSGSEWELAGPELVCGGPAAPPAVVTAVCGTGQPAPGDPSPETASGDGPRDCGIYTARYPESQDTEDWSVTTTGVGCDEAFRILDGYVAAPEPRGSSGHATVDGYSCFTDLDPEQDYEFTGGCSGPEGEIRLSSP